jgi:hypothetical protein
MSLLGVVGLPLAQLASVAGLPVNHSTAVADAVANFATCASNGQLGLLMTSSLGAICESRIKIIHRLKCEMHHVAVVHAVV